MIKRICFFGSYVDNHRNRSLKVGLIENGYEVVECHDGTGGVLKYWRLARKLWALKGQYDALLIGFPNHGLVPWARCLSRRPLIFDPFISLYNTIVEDRQQQSRYSLRAWWAKLLDTVSVALADIVLSDTAAHADYFARTFKVNRKKFVVVPVGPHEETLNDRIKPTSVPGEFAVKFCGTYSPLQGVQYIVDAAKLLQAETDIHFYLLGNGQTYSEMFDHAKQLGLKNLTFLNERVPPAAMVDFLATADICLGIFGGTIKSDMVIPHKVYDSLALKKPVITGDTTAAREFFVSEQDILLVEEANPADLADKILRLKTDKDLREKLARTGYELTQTRFSAKAVLRDLVTRLARC